MFIAYMHQPNGCDYTIGCGSVLVRLKANNYDEAIKELKKEVIGEWLPDCLDYEEGYWGELRLDEVILFEIKKENEISLDAWYLEAEEYADNQKRMSKEMKEMDEYKRLKEKFG